MTQIFKFPNVRTLKFYTFLSVSFVCIMLSASSVLSNDTLDSFRDKIAGQNFKKWQYKRIIMKLGANKPCKSGKYYKFFNNGKLEIVGCIKGALSKQETKWELVMNGIDVEVIFEGFRYRTIYSKKHDDDNEILILRTDGTKPESTVDIKLMYIP